MAELELTLRYNSMPAKCGLAVMLITLPLWGVAAPVGTFSLIYSLLQPDPVTASYNPITADAVRWLCASISLPILGIILSLFFADNRLLANSSGLFFPSFLSPFRRKLSWSKVGRISFEKNSHGGKIVIHTTNNRSIKVDVRRLIPSEVDQLLLAADVWGGKSEKSAELIEYRQSLQRPTSGSEQTSYTAMWEQELERRFATTAFMPLDPDTKLQNGTLKVVRQLSFGGFSAIYLCLRNDKELVVLKEAVIPSNSRKEMIDKALELFEREAQLLGRLEHTNIVKVLDHFTENKRQYILLQYLNGQDLLQLVKQQGSQNESLVFDWTQQLVSVLAYLHKQNPAVIHRDFTPDNIVVAEDGSVCVIDFGAANELLGQATGTLVGKQAYISPEQFRGKATAQSDLYALGCTIFFLLTGQDPEPLSTSRPRMQNSTISGEVDELVAHLTALELNERIQDCDELQARLNAINNTAAV
jgi:serine/threonine-protein kinase